MQKKIAVTGASGFVGGTLCTHLIHSGIEVLPVTRRAEKVHGVRALVAGTDFKKLKSVDLVGCDTVVHCAARVHRLDDEKKPPEILSEQYSRTNVEASVRTAVAAYESGVERFVFVSTLHVHGRSTPSDVLLTEKSEFHADSLYAKSKLRAEKALMHLAADYKRELVIVRPPLVYGLGVQAKFAQLVRWIAAGKSLPFGGLNRNLRSYIAVENLADFLQVAALTPAAAGQAFIVSDDDNISTAELIERIKAACGSRSFNWHIPMPLLRLGLAVIGRASVLEVLDGTLATDISHAKKTLNWKPRVTMQQALNTWLGN